MDARSMHMAGRLGKRLGDLWAMYLARAQGMKELALQLWNADVEGCSKPKRRKS